MNQMKEKKKNKKNQQVGKLNKYDQLVVDIHNNLSTRLTDLMSKLLNTTQDKLFNMSDEADNNEDQRRFFELMNQIRELKPEIAVAFDENILDYLLPAKEFDAKEEKKQVDSDDDELSLIEQDAMEGIVLVKGIGERATSKYREQLSHLEARLEHLALQSDTVFKKDALVPTNFCQAFDDALADNFNNDNKKLLFSMFDTEIASKLDALYDSINNRMIDAEILPQIKLSALGNKSASRSTNASPSAIDPENGETQDDYIDDGQGGYAPAHPGGSQPVGGSGTGHTGGRRAGDGGNTISGFAMTAAPGGNYRHAGAATQQGVAGGAPDGNYVGGAPGGNYPGGASAGQANMPSGEQGNVAGSGEYQHYTAGMPASQVGRVVGNYIGGTPINPETADRSSENYADPFPASTQQHFGHKEIIQALSRVQQLPQFAQPEEVNFDADAIKQAVLSEIAKTSGGAVTKRINQIAEKTIDFIELIFDAIIDDMDISDTIKALLLRLQIPIIKASMADQEFFIYDEHPARVLLDTIADVGVGITDHEDEMYIHFDKAITTILGEHDLTTDVFQTALDNLTTYIEEQDKLASENEEEEQKQLLRKHARATVLKSLRATTTGKTLPEAVHPLILKRWPTLMFNHYLNYGKENNEWINMVLSLRQIVESVQPIKDADQLAKLLSRQDLLLEQTEAHLNLSSNSKKDVETVMAAYSTTMQEMINDANFTEEEISDAVEIRNEAGPEEELPVEEEYELPEIPPNVMPGTWFQVYMGEDKTARRCKLSVVIIEDANMMFVNHKGELVIEKTFEEFNKEVEENKTVMIMGHSVFDHAFKSVISGLN
jgi:hypothetical protein